MIESVESIDSAEKLNVDILNSKIKKGVAVLTLRTIFLQAISFFSNLILTVLLLPIDYGVFFLVAAIVNLLAYFSDIGFAASLIQKKDKPTREDLQTVFTTQQILVFGLIILVFVLTPLIKNFYNFSPQAVYLLWALAISLCLSSLKTIPSVLLERNLEFNKLVIPQIAETIVFNVTVVFFAWQGFGVSSFTIAVIFRGITGLVAMYIVSPWMPGFLLSIKSLKSVLKFGVPYQANSLLAMVKDDGIIIFLGSILGIQGVGLLGWAQKWAYSPLRFFMDQVIKVTFPAFSRLQNNKIELSKAVTKSIMFICFLVFPSLIMLVLLSPILVDIIPKYSKWSPALFALSILALNCALAAITTPLTNTLNAIGKISLTFKLMIMWTSLTWIFVPLLAFLYGLNGAAVGLSIVGLSSFIALYFVSKYVNINYLQSVGKPLLSSTVMGICVFLVKNIFSVSWTQVIVMIATSFISYLLLIIIIEPKILTLVKEQFRKKQ